MGLPRRRVDEMLEAVGLSGSEGDRRIGNYSLGMRQRLGIAHALLGDPQVLILDEPANGLDPAGIHWMRRLLKGFAERGGTVLLSSHLLHEIEVIADHLVVIGRGVIVADGSKAELLSGVGMLVRGPQPDALARSLDLADLPTAGVRRRVRRRRHRRGDRHRRRTQRRRRHRAPRRRRRRARGHVPEPHVRRRREKVTA